MKKLWTVNVHGKIHGVYDTEARAIATCQEIGLGAELHEYHMTKAEYKATMKTLRDNFKPARGH